MTTLPETGVLPLATESPGHVGSWIKHNVDLWIPALLLLVIVLLCYLGPQVFGLPGPLIQDLNNVKEPMFSPGHLLGTDDLGRDTLSRLLYGGRTSFAVGVASNVVGFILGGLIGLIAGYRGGWVDIIISRLLDVLVAFPSLVLMLVVAAYLGPSEINTIWAIALFSIPAYARLARAAAMRLRGLSYISAARLGGVKEGTVMMRHIAPNVAPQLLTYSLLNVGVAIVLEASLSFLGVGVPLPAPSWGTMISSGQQLLSTNPQLVLIPSAMLFITVTLINLLGDAVRERWGKS